MKRVAFYFLAVAPLLIQIAKADVAERWSDVSDPTIVNTGMNYVFSALPLAGHNDKLGTGWSDDFWPSKKGSINRRWNAPGEPGFKLNSPSKEMVKAMTLDQLAQLAPSEKYDLWLGQYTYPTVQYVSGFASPSAKEWAGICNGWSPASLNLTEPKPVVMTNPDGIKIPFGSSDIKALVSFSYAEEESLDTHQIGLRCYLVGPFAGLQRGCGNDVNPGAMHIIMANKLGLERKGFLADVDRGNEIWNQPIVGYETRIVDANLAPKSDAASGTVREVRVETDLIYTDEATPNWTPNLGTEKQKFAKLEMQYRLELNTYGQIIGGTWESWIRPDFIWFRGEVPFAGMFAPLSTLYQASISQ